MKVLITGSASFILSNFIRKATYEKLPYILSSVDKIVGNANAIYYHKNHSFHLADICDEHIIDKVFQFEQPDVVLHGAAYTAVDDSIISPNQFIQNNILGTQNIINACVKHKVKRIIYVSTDEVLGSLKIEDPSWTEDAPLNPRNPYAATKAAGEMLIKAAYHSYGLTYNIIRSSNNYGPRQTPEKLIPKVIKCILNDQPIPIYGQGLQIRDWTHVFDNCAAFNIIINNGQPNEIYHISANQEITNLELIQKICNKMDKGHNLISHIPDPRPGHDFRYSINCDKIKKIGWFPKIKLSYGLDQTIDWYLLNQYFLK